MVQNTYYFHIMLIKGRYKYKNVSYIGQWTRGHNSLMTLVYVIYLNSIVRCSYMYNTHISIIYSIIICTYNRYKIYVAEPNALIHKRGVLVQQKQKGHCVYANAYNAYLPTIIII